MLNIGTNHLLSMGGKDKHSIAALADKKVLSFMNISQIVPASELINKLYTDLISYVADIEFVVVYVKLFVFIIYYIQIQEEYIYSGPMNILSFLHCSGTRNGASYALLYFFVNLLYLML